MWALYGHHINCINRPTFIGLQLHRVDRREFWHTCKNWPFSFPFYVYSFHSHFWHIWVPIPMGFPWESNGNGNPIPMHISRLQDRCRFGAEELDVLERLSPNLTIDRLKWRHTPSRRSHCKCCKMFTFSFSISWRQEQLAQIEVKKWRHWQPM